MRHHRSRSPVQRQELGRLRGDPGATGFSGRCAHHPTDHASSALRTAPAGSDGTPPLGHRRSDHRRSRGVGRSLRPPLRRGLRAYLRGYGTASRVGCTTRVLVGLHGSDLQPGRLDPFPHLGRASRAAVIDGEGLRNRVEGFPRPGCCRFLPFLREIAEPW